MHPHKVTDKITLKTFCISVFFIVLSIRIWMNFWFCLILVFFAKKKYQSVIGKNYKIDSPMILLAIFFVTFFSFFPFFLKCSESKKIKTIIVQTILKNPWIFAFGWIWRFSPSYIRLSLSSFFSKSQASHINIKTCQFITLSFLRFSGSTQISYLTMVAKKKPWNIHV